MGWIATVVSFSATAQSKISHLAGFATKQKNHLRVVTLVVVLISMPNYW